MRDEETNEERLPQAAVSKQVHDAEVASSAADDMRAQELPQDIKKKTHKNMEKHKKTQQTHEATKP